MKNGKKTFKPSVVILNYQLLSHFPKAHSKTTETCVPANPGAKSYIIKSYQSRVIKNQKL